MITNLDTLEFFNNLEIVGALDLAEHLHCTENYARVKLTRLHKAGLIEPAITERGKWILSVNGVKQLETLRRREHARDRRTEASGATG